MSLIVFDLDGTLVDSRLDLAESTNEVLASYGASPLKVDTVAAMVGEGAKVLVMRALAAAGLAGTADEDEALQRFRDIYDRRLLIHTRPYPGIDECIRALASTERLAVLTNKPEAPSRRLLEAFGLADYFPRVIGGDSGFARKPEPAGLAWLMRDAGTTPSTTWLVGDSMIDVETSRRAGVRMCVALYGFGQMRGELVLDGSEQTIATAAEIPAALKIKRSHED